MLFLRERRVLKKRGFKFPFLCCFYNKQKKKGKRREKGKEGRKERVDDVTLDLEGCIYGNFFMVMVIYLGKFSYI